MDEEQLRLMAAQLRKPSGDAGIATGEFMNKGNVQMHKDTYSLLHAQGSEHILEIGMGNGFFVKDILEDHPQVKYTGCDFSELMISEACRLNERYIKEGRAEFLLAKADTLPLKPETIDKVVTINTIYFWEQVTEVLNEFYRILKPGGLLFIAFRPERQMKNYPFTPFGFNLFSKEKVEQLLAEKGFSDVEVYENPEPDFDLKGQVMKMENTVISAKK